MANYEWLGDGGTNLASTNTCWSPTGVPTTGDVVIFNSKAGINNCNFDLTNASPTLTVDEIIIESDFNARVLLQTVPVIKGLFLNGYLEPSAASNIEFRHGASPNFFGSYKTYDSKFILIGDNANYNSGTITMSMYGSTLTKFDDGNHNETILNSGTFEPNYSTPTGTSGKTTFDALTINSGVTFAPTTTLTSNDRNKHFVIDNFTCNIDLFNGGEAIFQFKASSSGFNLPVRGASGYGSTPSATPTLFDSYFRKIILTADTAGHQVVMDDNTYIALEELEIGDGVMLKGPIGTGVQGSDIRLVNAPKVRGSWSFSEITSGIYRSPRTAEGPNAKVYGGFHITGKLTVDGLIDPTGMVFTPRAVNPESTNPQDTIWIDSETNHLFRGDRNVESTVHFNVRNDEGSTIPLGAPLYSKGEIGGSNRIKVGIADASDPNKMPAIGLAMQEMNTTSTKDGNMILTGIFNENITITGVVEQDIIYVAPHGGSAPYLTITRPTSGSHLVQNVGVCVRQSATNVSQGMKVAAIGRTNDSPNCSFLMVNTESTHPQARRLVAGTNITLTDGGAGGDLTIAASGGGGGGSGTVTSIATTAPITGGTITTTGTIGISAATTSADGSMSAGDKLKLDGIETNADVTDATNVDAAGAIMDSDFSANGLMERTGSGSYTSNTTILQTENLALHYPIGWHTFAVIKGRDYVGSNQRGQAQFYIQDKRSSRHRIARIEAGHMFGRDGSNFLTLLGTSAYGNEIAFTEFRIKEGDTYDGAALQIYISNDENDIDISMMFDLGTGDSWTLLSTMLADSDTAGHDALLGYVSGGYVDFATSMAVGVSLDIEETGFVDSNAGGGIATTGGLAVDGSARISGTLRQSVTNAVLVADGNGDLTAASTLQDVAYVASGQAETDTFTPTTSAPVWATPPTSIQDAIDRLASYTVAEITALGGAPVIP